MSLSHCDSIEIRCGMQRRLFSGHQSLNILSVCFGNKDDNDIELLRGFFVNVINESTCLTGTNQDSISERLLSRVRRRVCKRSAPCKCGFWQIWSGKEPRSRTLFQETRSG